MHTPKTSSFTSRIYGSIPYTEYDLRLFQTEAVRRLRHLSCSAVPPWLLPAGSCTNKFEHSVGALHHARIVGQHPDFKHIAPELEIASLGHDIGTIVFSHLAEHEFKRQFGIDHEEFGIQLCDSKDFKQACKDQGTDLDMIKSMIIGTYPGINLVNGDLDLDNLDNSLSYGLGLGILTLAPYSPERIARSMFLHEGKLAFKSDCLSDLRGWEKCRKDIYKFVYSEVNLRAGSVLSRAIDLASRDGMLTKEFFLMSDEEGFSFLQEKCGSRVAQMIHALDHWVFFKKIFGLRTGAPSQSLREKTSNLGARSEAADALSKYLSVEPEHVHVYFGKERGHKPVNLTLVSESGDISNFTPGKTAPTWFCQVYVNPSVATKANRAKTDEFLHDLIK